MHGCNIDYLLICFVYNCFILVKSTLWQNTDEVWKINDFIIAPKHLNLIPVMVYVPQLENTAPTKP